MNRRNNKTNASIDELGLMLGLEKKNMDQLLKEVSPRDEQVSFSLGPPLYTGGFYGTISVNDFENQSESNSLKVIKSIPKM